MDKIFGALKSKTMWTAIATIMLGTLVGPVQDWIAANPGPAATVAGLVFAFLRTITTAPLADKADKA